MMKSTLARLPLAARIAVARTHPFTLAAGFVLALLLGGLAWVGHATWLLEQERAHVRPRADAAPHVSRSVPAAPSGAQADAAALARFYDTLGPRRSSAEQVKTLFALAGQNGLVLRQGDYKAGTDRAAHVVTYGVDLPVKGSYGAVWRFALSTLQAMPFAALDDISFRRNAIGDPAVEARLRLTLYLADDAPDIPDTSVSGGAR
jgi:hypothetical protein